jgi:prepilin-type N-terminal cleavage/methylation domain-containing protein
MQESGIQKKRYGITLVEVLLAVGILGIIFMAAAAVYVQSGETTVIVKDRSTALFEAQEALERMVDEVRNCDGITTKATSSFTLTRNTQTTTFSYNTQTKSILRNNVAYIKGISALSILYYDKDGNSAVTAAQVVKMIITITATTSGESHQIKSSVDIRRKALQ